MKRKAFTVIELLAVISILAILASLLFPTFTQAKTTAQKSVCLSNLHQLGIATALYSADNGDRLPHAVGGLTKHLAKITVPEDRGPLFQAALELPTVDQALHPYSRSKAVHRCALDQVERMFLEENRLEPRLGWKNSYFETCGASYDFDDVTAVLEPETWQGQSDLILMCDYAAVHSGTAAELGGRRNLLFGDGHARFDSNNRWGTAFKPVSGPKRQ